jgi:two-component system cell cycle sensor histidine kinase/response regulator CckA
MTADASASREPDPLPNVPIVDRPGAPVAASPLERSPLEVRKRLLVVDDEPPVLHLVKRILATDNYEIRAAGSGLEAARMLDEPGFGGVDLLVTDLMMPGMNGRELAALVRQRFPATRVLYQTGFADSLFSGVKELGQGEAFIEKPFSASGLLEATRLLMFGQIADDAPQSDKRDDAAEWQDDRFRAKLVRLLRRFRIA